MKKKETPLAFCTDAKILSENGKVTRIGDPTELALLDANLKYGLFQKLGLILRELANLLLIRKKNDDGHRQIFKIGFYQLLKGPPMLF